MIIDCHTHAGNYQQVIDDQTPHLELLVRDMELAGVDESWVMPIPTGPDEPVSQQHNQAFIENVRKYKNLLPFCAIDASSGIPIRSQLQDAIGMGAVGWKFHPILQSTAINARELFPAYEMAEQQQVPVLIHAGQFIGHKVAGKTHPGPLRLADPLGIDDVADAFPNLKIIMAHFGWPWHEQSIAIATRRENVYLDLAGWAPKHFPPALVPYLLKAIPHKFLFGTDYPFVTPQRWLSEFQELCANRPDTFQAVCKDNIEKLRMPN